MSVKVFLDEFTELEMSVSKDKFNKRKVYGSGLYFLFLFGTSVNSSELQIERSELSILDQVQLSPTHKATYTYRDNGQLSRAKLDNATSPPTGQEPSAIFTVTPGIGGTIADTHQFDANTSTDPQQPDTSLLARWDFNGDGIWDTPFSTDKSASHKFAQQGDYLVRLEIKDSDGYSSVADQVVRVFNDVANVPPQALITASVGASVVVGTPISLSAAQSSDGDGEIQAYEWDFGDGSATRTYVSQTHTYSSVGNVTISLTVTDDRGAVHTTSKLLSVLPNTGPQAPTIVTQSGQTAFNIQQGSLLDIPLTILDADTALADLSVIASGLTGAYVQLIGGQYHLFFQPSGNQTGSTTATVNIQDPEGPTASLNLTISITSVTDPGQSQWQITQQGSPLVIGSDINAIAHGGNYLYLEAGSTKDLVPVDISNPAAPLEHTYINIPGAAEDVDYENGRVYLGSYNSGVRIYSASSSPGFLGQYAPNGIGSIVAVEAAGNTAFASNDSGTLHVINASNASNPTTYKTIAGVGGTYKLLETWNGLDYLYIGTPSGVKVLDYQNPGSAAIVGTPISGNIQAIHIPENENKLYVGMDNILKVYDITNRTSPSFIASLAVGADTYDKIDEISVDENGNIFLFLNGYETGEYFQPIVMLGLSGNTLSIHNQFDLETTSRAIHAHNGYLYIDRSDSLYIYHYELVTNHTPLTNSQVLSVQTGQTIPITLTASDSDGDILSYHYVVDSIDYGSLSGTAPNLTYTAASVGQDSLRFYVNDGAVDSLLGTVVINVVSAHSPPVVNAIPAQQGAEAGMINFTVSGYDPDFGDTYSIAASNLPAGALFQNNQFSWVPVPGQASGSPYVITFIATDSTGLTSLPVTASITVNHINVLPEVIQFSSNLSTAVAPLEAIFIVQASDTDGAIVSTVLDYGDGQQGSALSHSYTVPGNYTATVTVTDNSGGQDSQQLSLTVEAVQHGSLQFVQTSLNVDEDVGVASMLVERVGGDQGAVSVECFSTQGSATDVSDFTPLNQTLNWAAGDTDAKQCDLGIIDDADVESSENLSLGLRNPGGGTMLGSVVAASVTLIDNDNLALQVDRQSISIQEGATSDFRVRLTARPTSSVDVTVSHVAGDSDLTIQAGSSLIFESSDWDQYQTVTVDAANDVDAVTDQASFEISSNGLSTLSVIANEIEDDVLEILVDNSTVNLTEGATKTLQVSLSAQPESGLSVAILRASGDIGVLVSPSSLTFNTGNWNVAQVVTLTSQVDANTDDGVAIVTASASGLTTVSVLVNHQEDADRDGVPDYMDVDDDNDGMPDTWESQYGLDPYLASDASLDNDNDGISNLDEYNQGTNPLIQNTANIQYEVMKRAEIAKPLVLKIYGLDFIPPEATGATFTDVQPGDFNADWIEKLTADGITEGCSINHYCPNMVVTKEQLSIMLLKAKHGKSYVPPVASGSLFTDVNSGSFAVDWIEALVNQDIADGCDPNNFCPNEAVTLEGFETMLNKAFP